MNKPPVYMTWIRPSVPFWSSGNSWSEQCLHIGNYYGAIKTFIESSWKKRFLIADSSTLSGSDSYLERKNIISSAAAYYALWVIWSNDDSSYMYLQSWWENHNTPFYELYALLSSSTKVEDILIELERRKTKEGRSYTIWELDLLDFWYPNHMAADVILANPDAIPIGESNVWNLEFIQRTIKKLNDNIGETSNKLQIPKIIMSDPLHQNILGTCGTGVKMSKSDNNFLSVFIDREWRKKEIGKIAHQNISAYFLSILDPSVASKNLTRDKKHIFTILEDSFRGKNKVYDEVKLEKDFIEGLLEKWNALHLESSTQIMKTIRGIYFR